MQRDNISMNAPNLKTKTKKFLESCEKTIAKLLFWLIFLICWAPHKLLSYVESVAYKKNSEQAEKSKKELCFKAKKNGVVLQLLVILGLITTFVLIAHSDKQILAVSSIIAAFLTFACMLIQYFRNQNATRHFQFSRHPIFVNTHSLHLSKYLIDMLKNIKKEGEASELLHNHYYQNPYLEALGYAFDDLNAKVVTRKTHHLGQDKVRYAAEKLLKDNGYEVEPKEVSPFCSVVLRALLCFELNKMKPSDFDSFHIYKFTITKKSAR
ncbi:hypothetical protein L1D37_18130 [Vibrio sp. Isolate33]|uniref:hypothetical protein n=1 Tax=Vibrio sp. Isolate33 TaxID=2908539 RepID=UPI001EFDEDA4|nr:hypothetical protein [Vibrio sp. Isolate33]MCG9545658.1 hypothetical protein [Vibrio sp. Isolate33]